MPPLDCLTEGASGGAAVALHPRDSPGQSWQAAAQVPGTDKAGCKVSTYPPLVDGSNLTAH